MGNGGEKVSWKRVLILAGAVIAFTIGSGFATGQEIIQYYTAYGVQSLLVILVFAVAERDLDKMHFDISLYELYVKGYLEATRDVLTPEEVESLPWGARLMTFECGIRFLTDYLEGDTYFKTAYPEHNLVRARTQFRLVDEMEQQFAKMQEIVRQYA